MMPKVHNGNKLEFFVLSLFIISLSTVMAFHEPWYDEALSWQIGKCANLTDLFINLPPYEGHPPLWDLILLIPARLGIPFEIGLKSVGFLFTTVSVALLLFKSKIHRSIKIILPFSYFIFYQYGVIVRPYSLMFFSLLLLGMMLPQKEEQPWRIFFLLTLLCLTNAFGILFAGGISVCIVWEIWRKKGTIRFIKELLKDNRTLSLVLLLLLVLIIIIEFYPPKDGYSNNIQGSAPITACLLCTFFSILPNILFLSSSWFGVESLSVSRMAMPTIELAGAIILGAFIWFIIICVSSRKNLKYFLAPYSFYAGFAAIVYFSSHHLGMAFLLLVFWMELVSRDPDHFEIGRSIAKKIIKTEKDKKLIQTTFKSVLTILALVSLFWTVSAVKNEINQNYFYGREVATFLKEKGISTKMAFSNWNNGYIDLDNYNDGHDDYLNTYMIDDAILILPYFDENIFYNLNGGKNSKAFVYHKIPSYYACRSMVAEWRKAGVPDLIIGHPDLGMVFDDDTTYEDYALVKEVKYGFIYKNMSSSLKIPVYIKRELLEQYELTELDNNMYDLRITDEMIEDYKSGKSAEDILKPYFEALFNYDN